MALVTEIYNKFVCCQPKPLFWTGRTVAKIMYLERALKDIYLANKENNKTAQVIKNFCCYWNLLHSYSLTLFAQFMLT